MNYFRFFCITLLLLLLTSCQNFFSGSDDLSSSSKSARNYVSFTGNICLEGAYPQEFVPGTTSATNAPRTAFPTIPADSVYRVTASKNGTIVYDSTSTNSGIQISADKSAFEITQLETGVEWTIIVGIYENSDTNYTAPLMSDTYPVTLTAESNILTHDFVLKPALTDGKGKIYLMFNFPMNAFDDISLTCLNTDNQNFPYFSDIQPNYNPGYILLFTNTDDELIDAGSYEIQFDFKKNGMVLYSDIQTINIFKNMQTRHWVNNGDSEAIKADGTYEITQEMIDAFSQTQIFVGTNSWGTASDSGNGSRFAPFNTLQKAISYIETTGKSTKNYTIWVSGGVNGGAIQGNTTLDDSLNGKSKSITIRGLNSLNEVGEPLDYLFGYADKLKNVTHINNDVQDYNGINVENIFETDEFAPVLKIYSSDDITLDVRLKDIGISKGAARQGAGIHLYGAHVKLTINEGTLISDNHSSLYAGGLYVDGSASCIMNGGKITENSTYHSESASSGGGIEIANGGNFTMNAGEISNNRAMNFGGGVSLRTSPTATQNQSRFTMNGGKISGNYANGETPAPNNTKSGHGGAVYIHDGTFTMSAGEISGNYTNCEAGAVYIAGVQDPSATFDLQGGIIKNNTLNDASSSSKCSGIYLNTGALKMKGAANVDSSNNIYLANGKYIEITDALTATSSVATITPSDWTRGKTVVQADGTKVTDLTPYKDYFAFTKEGWEPKVSADKLKFFTDAPIYVAGTGRKVCTTDGSDETGEGTKAKPFASITKAATLMNGSSVDYTIYIDGTVTGPQTLPDKSWNSLTIEGVNGLDENSEPKDVLDGNKSGTTLTVNSKSPVTITNLKITDGNGTSKSNKTYGGGIYISDINGRLALGDGALVTKNSAEYGGGIYNCGKLYLYGTAMVGMKTTELATSSSYGNKATVAGAGIYADSYGQIYLGYSSWTSSTNNTPSELTGGVCGNYNAQMTPVNNNGGGIYLNGTTNTAKIEIASGNISYNYAMIGAGIYAIGNVKMTGGTIEGNEGGNYQIAKGSGLYLANYNANESTFTMSGSAVIKNNKNVWLGAGVYLLNDKCKLEMNGGEISGNIALSYGGAVYMNGSSSLNIQGTANIPYGGAAKNNDIYIPDSVKIKITGPLSDRDADKVIGLTPNSYTEGRPLLEVGTGVTLTDELEKFTVTPQATHPEITWRVNYQGNLSDGYDAAEITLENYESITKVSVTSADGMKVISSLSDSTNKKTFDGKTITLKEDISLGSDFTPIGSGSSGFKGTFDGNNKIITINNAVVFKYLAQNSLVKNLNLAGSTTQGYPLASGDVSGTVEYCTSTVRITNCASAGGFVYRVTTNGKVQYCINKGTIDLTGKASGNSAGGIAYSVYGGTVDRCINEANISGKNIYLGGIAGTITWHGTISNCKNTGNVNTSQSVSGGIVALMNSDGAGIKNCSSSGTIISSSSTSSTQILYIVGKVSTGLCPVENTCDQTYYHSSNSSKTGYSSNIDDTLSTLNSWASTNNGVSWKKNGSILELDLSW